MFTMEPSVEDREQGSRLPSSARRGRSSRECCRLGRTPRPKVDVARRGLRARAATLTTDGLWSLARWPGFVATAPRVRGDADLAQHREIVTNRPVLCDPAVGDAEDMDVPDQVTRHATRSPSATSP